MMPSDIANIWKIFAGTVSIGFSLAASLHAILRKRESRSAALWIMTAWSVPFLGPFLYVVFGINRIQRRAARLRYPRSRTLARRQEGERRASHKEMSLWPDNLTSLSKLVGTVTKTRLVAGNKITPLLNGEGAYPPMIEAIRGAQKTVGLCTYIFNDDKAGRLFIDALNEAAKRGVQVRVLIDDVGAGFFYSSVYDNFKRAGVPVAYFLPSLAPWRMAYLNMRNHRKILTVDGTIGFTGSMNIHENHFVELGLPGACSDIHFRVEGPIVEKMQEVFREDWHFTTGELLDGPDWFPALEPRGNAVVRGIDDGPDVALGKSRWAILGALANAKKSVRLVTPYFIPDSAVITALNLAAMSGARVDILIPDSSDLNLVKWASQAMLWQVLERGCRVWRTPRPFDHAKLMLVDGGWTLLGSSNLDPRSFRLNFEFNLECYDKDLTRDLEKLVDEKISRGREVTLADMDSRPLPIRLRDGVSRLISPIL